MAADPSPPSTQSGSGRRRSPMVVAFKDRWSRRYYCAADKPLEDAGFPLTPVYRTTRVPADEACAECGLSIRDLQRSMA